MAQHRDEHFSALIDGHHRLDDSQLEALKTDPQAAERWQRYHLIGDTLRGELPASVELDICARVAAALDDEPALLAPKAVSQPRGVKGFWRPVMQFAVAASVALVAIVGVQQYGQHNDLPQPASTPVLSTLPALGTAAPVSLEANPQREQQGRLVQAEQQRRVNAYLQDHAQQLRLQDNEQTQQQEEANPQ